MHKMKIPQILTLILTFPENIGNNKEEKIG